MVDELINLCEDTIQALLMLKLEDLISENELERHLEKKIVFIEAFR